MSVFRRLAQRITVADLQDPLGPPLEPQMDIGDAQIALMEAAGQSFDLFERVSLVLNEAGEPLSYLFPEDMSEGAAEEGALVSEVAEPLHSSLMLSGDTTAMTAVKLLGSREKPFAFVLCGSQITGLLSWSDFYKPEFAVCVLALMLEVEQLCLDVALRDPDAAWATLNPRRQAKAREVYALRHDRDSEEAGKASLLRCTTFIDKQALVQNSGEVSLVTRPWLRGFFQRAEGYRNYFSHTGEDTQMGGVSGLAELITDTERFVALFTPPAEPTLRIVR